MPVAVLQFSQADEAASVPALPDLPGAVSRRLTTAATALAALVLSNGQYSLMLTNAGGGYSGCRAADISRWRSDGTRDLWGQFIYLRAKVGRVWSASFQPTECSSRCVRSHFCSR